MRRIRTGAGRLLAALLLGIPAGAGLYVLRLVLAHPMLGQALLYHPLLVLPALLGVGAVAGAVWGALALTGIAPDAHALHWCMVCAAVLIFILSERGERTAR